MKLWKLRICCGWFKGNPVVGLKISVFEPITDYHSGWQGVNLFGFMFLRFEFGIWLNNHLDPNHKHESSEWIWIKNRRT